MPFPKRTPAIFLAVLLLAACKEEAKKDPSASAAPTNSAIPDDFVVNSFFAQNKNFGLAVDGSAAFGDQPTGDSADAKSKVIDPGGEPKAKLAYTFALNKTQTIVATVTQEIGGADVPPGQGKQPPLKLTLAATPKKKDGSKTAMEIKVVKFEMVGAPPDVQAKLAPLQASLAKVSANMNVTNEGVVSDLEFAGTDTLQRGPAEQVLGIVAHLASTLYVPVPSVPIGPNARWTSTITQDTALGPLFVDSTYTFVAKTDANYDFKLETNSHSVPKTVQDPQSGKKVTLESKGSGTSTFSTALDGPAYKSAGDQKTDHFVSENQGPKKTITEKMTVAIEKSK